LLFISAGVLVSVASGCSIASDGWKTVALTNRSSYPSSTSTSTSPGTVTQTLSAWVSPKITNLIGIKLDFTELAERTDWMWIDISSSAAANGSILRNRHAYPLREVYHSYPVTSLLVKVQGLAIFSAKTQSFCYKEILTPTDSTINIIHSGRIHSSCYISGCAS